MRTRAAFFLTLFALVISAGTAFAQYTKAAGQNAPKREVRTRVIDDNGVAHERVRFEAQAADKWGNVSGNNNDLAIDGAFEGQTVAVIQLYTGFDFSLPKAALKEKGFSVYRWVGKAPSPSELEAALAKSSQLWIISDTTQHLTADHLRVIKRYWEAGHGLYLWGDNQPFYADANFIAEALFDTTMQGDLMGDKTVGLQKRPHTAGLLPNHLLTTGLENIYEGITIATIQPSTTLEPLIYGSAGNLVASYYDRDGRRAILDGGFTRLYMKWDTAGTARYVKNAASWLVNAEKFGDAVVNPAVRAAKPPVAEPPVTIAIAPPVARTAPRTTPRQDVLATGWIGLVLAGATLLLLLGISVPLPDRRS